MFTGFKKNLRVIVTFSFLLILLFNPTRSKNCDEWPMLYKDPQHTNYSGYKMPDVIDVFWSYEIKDMTTSSPAIVNCKLYIGSGDDDRHVYCLDAETGKMLWKYKTGGEVRSSSAVVNGKVYVGSFDKNVYCLDAETGKKLWSYETGDIVASSPAVVNGRLYIGSKDHNVYCLDAKTGKKLWSYTTDNAVWSSPAVSDDKVYVNSGEYMYCLNAESGEEIWIKMITPGGAVASSPFITDNKVYIGCGRNLYCLDTDTGEELWSCAILPEHSFLVFSAIADGRLYVSAGGRDSNFYCLDAETGKELWVYKKEREYAIFDSLAIADSKLYIAVSPHYLYCIDVETGKKLWEYKEISLITPLVIANGKIYAGSCGEDNKIYCFGYPEEKGTALLDFIPVLLILVLFFGGLFLWKKRKIAIEGGNIKLNHKLMILIGIFSVISALSSYFLGMIASIIFYSGLIIISSLTVLLFLIEEFWQSIVSLFFSFFVPLSVSSFIIYYPTNEAENLAIASSIFIPSVMYLLLVLLSAISLLLSNRGKSRARLVISPFLFFFVLFLITIYIFNENPSDTGMVFVPFMVIVSATVYLAYDKVLQWKKEEEKKLSNKKILHF